MFPRNGVPKEWVPGAHSPGTGWIAGSELPGTESEPGAAAARGHVERAKKPQGIRVEEPDNGLLGVRKP